MIYDSHITNLVVKNFKVHNHCNIEIPKGVKNVALVGKNGSGKTSILEALSLFSPGKGMINGNYSSAINSNNQSEHITITAQLASSYSLDITIKKNQNNKELLINNKKQTKQSELYKFLTILWFTPNIQYDFANSKTERRKIFDRLVFYTKPQHLEILIDYEKIIKQRLNLLEELSHNDIKNNKMLDILEEKISQLNYDINLNRTTLIDQINSTNLAKCCINNSEVFIKMQCDELQTDYKIEHHKNRIISESVNAMRINREKDKYSCRTNFGAHRADFLVQIDSQHTIKYNSSGEQKMILVSILLKTISIINNRRLTDNQIIFLGDEVLSFLDQQHVNKLLSSLQELNCQIWVTAVDRYEKIFNEYNFYTKELQRQSNL